MSQRVAGVVVMLRLSWASGALGQDGKGLWSVYDQSLKGAKCADGSLSRLGETAKIHDASVTPRSFTG